MKKIAYFVLGLALVACSGNKQETSAGDNTFAVVTLAPTEVNLNTSYPATIKGVQDVEIRAKVAGNIVRQFVDEGAFVNAGQALFEIDPTQYRAAVEQAQAAVNVAKANIATQELTVQNKKTLREKEIISQYDLDVAVNNLAMMRAQLSQAQAALVNAKDQLSFCTVRATSSGVVGSIPFRVGALVSSATVEPLTTVSNLSQMYAYFSMTEKQLLEMTRNSGGINGALKDMPAVNLVLADGSTYSETGKVNSVSGIIDATTGSVQMRATFNNPHRILRSGATGAVKFPVRQANAITIPQKATYEIQDKRFVYVVDAQNKVKAVEIQTLVQNDGKDFVVTSGLKAGDRVVVEGISKLRNDMEIKPVTPQQSADQLKKSQQHMADKKMPGQE